MEIACSRRGRRRVVAAVAVAVGALWLTGSTGAQAAVNPHAVSLSLVWSQTLLDNGGPIALSSPNVASLPGGSSVVVGDRAGHVYGFNLASGAGVPNWPVSTGGVPVDSTPSVAAINGNGLDSVFVGVGNAATPTSGGYAAISPSGAMMWFTNVQNPATDTAPAKAVQASMTVGNLNGSTDVVAGSLGEVGQAMNAASGAMLAGFPWFQADSNFTTPALADVYGNGRTDIVEGGDSSAGSAYGQTYTNGGHLRVLSPTGNAGTGNPAGGLICQYNTDQTVQSSPAIGEFGGSVGIVFGTGATFSANTTNDLIEVDAHCNPRWVDKLDGTTTSSPALADILGNGQLQVLEGTRVGAGGSIWALNGISGGALWRTATAGQVIGSPVTADLTGGGYQDVLVPTTAGVQIFDGKSGALVTTLGQAQGLAFQSSPLVTDDPNGSIGVTLAGYNSSNQGVIQHYEVSRSNGATVNETGAWPMFHHDPQLTGNAGVAPPVVQVPCNAPKGGPVGYDMTASDGGVFNFGNLPFCGSTGNLFLNQPVVGMTVTPDGGGYWLVASDGGVFAFGDAAFHGSAGNIALTKPMVGMAVTADGGGYWLVASDGGIFSYGDAAFHGSAGNIALTKPVVGMAVTADGGGYWLVASDGGVFSYGDAAFKGSTGNIRLTKPMVGMAVDSHTGGYWLVASDGGVFSYSAPFFGSTGNIQLAQPMVGMMSTRSGDGYRLAAADGGIFSYHAAYYGSTGNIHLVRPVVGVAGF